MDAIDKHFGHPAHLPRAGLPGEMGSVVAFLASRRNSYMTGANINVDGGRDFTYLAGWEGVEMAMARQAARVGAQRAARHRRLALHAVRRR